jgi:hypothetical protein
LKFFTSAPTSTTSPATSVPVQANKKKKKIGFLVKVQLLSLTTNNVKDKKKQSFCSELDIH